MESDLFDSSVNRGEDEFEEERGADWLGNTLALLRNEKHAPDLSYRSPR